MTKSLFDSFNEVSSKEWKQKIQFDLKGDDYNATLIHKSIEGIDIKPFYHKDDNINFQHIDHPSTWLITDVIEVEQTEQGNREAVKAIENGAECIFFTVFDKEIEIKELIRGIPDELPIYIETKFLSETFGEKLRQIDNTIHRNIYHLTDIIGNLTKTGNWFHNIAKDFEILENLMHNKNCLKNLISVDMGLLQNAGASIVQQLAYGLAHATEYLNRFENFKKDDLKGKFIVFKVASGGNYFFEIAKIRALRILWEILSSEFNLLKKCYIFAEPSCRNKTILDYNVNMLRTTTECMSAILGGADSIHNIRYDEVFNLKNEFANRMSTNQLLILKNESYFDMVDNAATGSYYIESLTNQLVDKSLELFKNIEKGGGYLKQLKSGIIQKKIKESAQKEQELFDQEEIILTGSNAFKNPDEIISNYQKLPFLEKKVRKTLLEPVVLRRLSEKIEKKLYKK